MAKRVYLWRDGNDIVIGLWKPSTPEHVFSVVSDELWEVVEMLWRTPVFQWLMNQGHPPRLRDLMASLQDPGLIEEAKRKIQAKAAMV